MVSPAPLGKQVALLVPRPAAPLGQPCQALEECTCRSERECERAWGVGAPTPQSIFLEKPSLFILPFPRPVVGAGGDATKSKAAKALAFTGDKDCPRPNLNYVSALGFRVRRGRVPCQRESCQVGLGRIPTPGIWSPGPPPAGILWSHSQKNPLPWRAPLNNFPPTNPSPLLHGYKSLCVPVLRIESDLSPLLQ